MYENNISSNSYFIIVQGKNNLRDLNKDKIFRDLRMSFHAQHLLNPMNDKGLI